MAFFISPPPEVSGAPFPVPSLIPPAANQGQHRTYILLMAIAFHMDISTIQVPI
jgi:hypothetical protein